MRIGGLLGAVVEEDVCRPGAERTVDGLVSDGEQQLGGVADGERAAVRVDHGADVLEQACRARRGATSVVAVRGSWSSHSSRV